MQSRTPRSITSLIVVTVVATAIVSVIAANVYVTRSASLYVLSEISQVPTDSTALVLGARVYRDGRLSRVLAKRVEGGVRLFEQGSARRIIVSGNDSIEHNSETTAMRRYAVGIGAPDSIIIEDKWGNDTYASCENAPKDRQIVVVTQQFHIDRAVFTCRQLGVDAVGYALSDDSLSPAAENFSKTREIAARLNAVIELVLR